MAEIKIEKKKSSGIWIILALVVLAIILYFYFTRTTDQDEKVTGNNNDIEQTTPNKKNTIVTNYISFVNDTANKMSLDHEYTNSLLLKLSNAIEAKANDIDYDVKADLSQAKAYAEKITIDPFETTHATNIRKAADILSTSLVNMQKAKYPSLTTEVTALQSAAASINPDVLTLDQKDAVKSFFGKAADLLSKMN